MNGDAAGVGFNDPTPAAPVGGNAGTTVGERRPIAFPRAADIWTPEIESRVDVSVPLGWDGEESKPARP